MMFDKRLTIPGSGSGAGGSKALRAIGWAELTARINAARDFRQVLHEDALMTSASFSDAAAGYFSGVAQGKRDVNPNALGRRKACDGTQVFVEGEAATDDREI